MEDGVGNECAICALTGTHNRYDLNSLGPRRWWKTFSYENSCMHNLCACVRVCLCVCLLLAESAQHHFMEAGGGGGGEWMNEWVKHVNECWMVRERGMHSISLACVYLHIVWFDVCWKHARVWLRVSVCAPALSVSVESKNQHTYVAAQRVKMGTRSYKSFRHTLNSKHVQNNTKNLGKQQITRTTASSRQGSVRVCFSVCVCLCVLRVCATWFASISFQ